MYILIYLTMVVFSVTQGRMLRANGSVVVLVGLGVAMLAFNPLHQDSIFNMITPFAYVMCYIIGFGLHIPKINERNSLLQQEKTVSNVIYIVAGGTFLHFLLNMISSGSNIGRNDVIDFWSKEITAATGHAALACVAIGVIIAFLFAKTGKLKKTIAIASLALLVIYNLRLGGRTLFAQILIVAAVAALYICLTEKRKILKTVIIIIVVVFLVIWLYDNDMFGIKTAV